MLADKLLDHSDLLEAAMYTVASKLKYTAVLTHIIYDNLLDTIVYNSDV